MAALPTAAIHLTVEGLTVAELAQMLRGMDPAVIGRIVNDRFAVDPRTLSGTDSEYLVTAFSRATE